MSWVDWSHLSDSTGQRMLKIGGGHYPQALAAEIAAEIVELLRAYPKAGQEPCVTK